MYYPRKNYNRQRCVVKDSSAPLKLVLCSVSYYIILMTIEQTVEIPARQFHSLTEMIEDLERR